MVLESTMICVDNSEYMRNGDFLPSRLQAQQDAVNMVCHAKTRSNPESNVGLLTLANSTEVLATLTTDVGRILTKLHQVQPKGNINFLTGIRIAHLALKHRQGKNHRTRIVVFVGSPVDFDEKDLIKLAKKLKKEKVNVDVVCFGDDPYKWGTPTLIISDAGPGGGPHLADALISSPVIQGEDGAGAIGLGVGGFDFVDPNEDPELALALRVSMEEQRQRQEEEARRAGQAPQGESGAAAEPSAQPASSEDAMLERALGLSVPDFSTMTEEEQIAYAMQMSMQDAQTQGGETKTEAMEVETPAAGGLAEDYDEVMNDPEFLQVTTFTMAESLTLTKESGYVIKWSGKEYCIDELDVNSTVLCLKKAIETVTMVKVDRQKLLNLKHKGKPAEDSLKLSLLALKPGFKIMMMGSLEEDIVRATSIPENMEEVLNDLDQIEEEIPLQNRAEYLLKVAKRIKTYDVKILNHPRPGKKLLVLDIDYTLFDHRSVAETGNELMRPFLHEFLESAYEDYDIMIWSATSMKWIEEKMKLLGVASNPKYKIVCYLDYLAMVQVHLPERGLLDASY
nr:EOG090X08NC [Eulimnadia texana]